MDCSFVLPLFKESLVLGLSGCDKVAVIGPVVVFDGHDSIQKEFFLSLLKFLKHKLEHQVPQTNKAWLGQLAADLFAEVL